MPQNVLTFRHGRLGDTVARKEACGVGTQQVALGSRRRARRQRRCGSTRVLRLLRLMERDGNDTKRRVDAADATVCELFGTRARAGHQVLEAIGTQQARRVRKRQVAVVHQRLQHGERVRVDTLQAIEYHQVASERSLDQRRVPPHGVAIAIERSLLQQVARRHVLVERHVSHAIAERLTKQPSDRRLAAALGSIEQ